MTLSTTRPRRRVGSERPSAETTPAVTELPKPFGLPIATTSCPTRRRVRVAELGRLPGRAPSARSTARSDSGSVPTTSTANSRPSTKEAMPLSARSTTCAEVSTNPSGVITTPLPPPSTRLPRKRRETRRLATDGARRLGDLDRRPASRRRAAPRPGRPGRSRSGAGDSWAATLPPCVSLGAPAGLWRNRHAFGTKGFHIRAGFEVTLIAGGGPGWPRGVRSEGVVGSAPWPRSRSRVTARF